jgi:hypothetical protein
MTIYLKVTSLLTAGLAAGLAGLAFSPAAASAAAIPLHAAARPVEAYVAGSLNPAHLPSCRHITYKGNAGAIHVQTSKKGYVSWGIYMYNRKLDDGPWVVDVYVGKRRVDHKKQDYAPHGSVNPKDAKKGKTFHIKATHHADANGKNYESVPNECEIP